MEQILRSEVWRCPVTVYRIFALLACGLLFAGCSNLTDPWTGEWHGAEGRILTLKEDGKAVLESNGITRATGKLTRLSSKSATLEMTSTALPQPGIASSRKQNIRLDEASKSFEYNRIRFRREK